MTAYEIIVIVLTAPGPPVWYCQGVDPVQNGHCKDPGPDCGDHEKTG